MTGFHWLYAGALVAIVLGALVRTTYYRVVQYVIDAVVGEGENLEQLPWLALSFVGLAVLRRRSGLRARDVVGQDGGRHHAAAAQLPLRSHPAAAVRLSRLRQDRRVDPAFDIGRGRAAAFLRRSGVGHRADRGAVRCQFHDAAADERAPGAAVHRRDAADRGDVVLVLRARLEGL